MLLRFLGFLIVLGACQGPDNKPCPDLPPLSNWDSIADADILNKTRYTPDSLFEWNNLSRFDTAISIRLQDGWGSFEYYAMLYVQSGAVRSDMFQLVDNELATLNDSFFKLPDYNYGRLKFGNIKKTEISYDVLRTIFQVIDSSNFWCTQKNAGQCRIAIDGLSWNLSVKVGNKFHRVSWTADCAFEKPDTSCLQNKCREMQSIAMRIFYAAGLSKSKYVLISKRDEIGKDSTTYYLSTPGPLLTNVYYSRGKLVPGLWSIIVSNQDKDWYKYLETKDIYADDTMRYKPLLFWPK